LIVAFEVLHCLDMAVRSRSLPLEDLDLVEFMVAQVASLSSSLACEVVITESPTPLPVACEVSDLQLDLVIPFDTPPRYCGFFGYCRRVVDPPPPLAVALEL
jgi:hypothetical protein